MKNEIQQIDLELLSKVFLGEHESTKIAFQLNDYFFLGESLADDNKLSAVPFNSQKIKTKLNQIQHIELNARFNKDGSLFCVYPKKSEHLEELFLNHDQALTDVFELIVKIESEPYFMQFTQNLPFNTYCVHLGDSTLHRHIVIGLAASETPICFLKMAHNTQSEEELIHEKHILSGLAFKEFKSFDCPSEFFLGNAQIEISSSVFRKEKKDEQHVKKLQIAYFNEILSHERKFIRLEEAVFWSEIQNKIANLKGNPHFSTLKEFCRDIDAHSKLIFTFSHGDFAACHCFYSEHNILFFSLKQSQFQAPAFYDLIDLVFENEKNQRTNLETAIESYVDNFGLRTQVDDLCVDLKPYMKIYLLNKAISLIHKTDKESSENLIKIMRQIQNFIPLKINA